MPHPRKRFAQHWLRSQVILDQILAAAHLHPRDRILEIGPGQGVLTRELLPRVQSLVAIEVDRDLCRLLARSFATYDHFCSCTKIS